jgi:hypothetical protein
MIRLAADQDWLHKAIKEISKYWRQKRARRMNPLSAGHVRPLAQSADRREHA